MVSLFDTQNTKVNLAELGKPLDRLYQVVNFEMFRNALENVFESKAKKNHAEAMQRGDDVHGDGSQSLLQSHQPSGSIQEYDLLFIQIGTNDSIGSQSTVRILEILP